MNIINKIRKNIAIPVFILWGLATSIYIGLIDHLPILNNPFVSKLMIYSLHFGLPLFLLFIRKPMWVRTLYGIGFCFTFFLFVVFGTAITKVPYDAAGCTWFGMISLAMYFLPVILIFILYSACEIMVKFIMKGTKGTQIIIFIVFLLAFSVICIAHPFPREIIKEHFKHLLASRGYIFLAGNEEIKIPSIYVKDYKRKKIMEYGDKGTEFSVSDGTLTYSLKIMLFKKELAKKYLKTERGYLRIATEGELRKRFKQNKNITDYKIGMYTYFDFPKLVKTEYRYFFNKDGKQYVKVGIIIITHTRIYLDISVVGAREDYDKGLLVPKFRKFLSSLTISGKDKGERKSSNIKNLSPKQLNNFINTPSQIISNTDSEKREQFYNTLKKKAEEK